ncbi:hypothetical protein [Micromonospora sp. DT47]
MTASLVYLLLRQILQMLTQLARVSAAHPPHAGTPGHCRRKPRG